MLRNIVAQSGQAPQLAAVDDSGLVGMIVLWLFLLLITGIVYVVHAYRRSTTDLRRTVSKRKHFRPVQSVEFGGTRFLLTVQDVKIKAWLVDLFKGRRPLAEPDKRQITLVRHRDQFRYIIHLRPVGGLVACLLEPDPNVRKAAIWLLGRCHAATSVPALRVLQWSRDLAIRRQVAFALKRMGKWRDLQWMAIYDANERVRHIADFNRRPYGDRLRDYVKHGGGELIPPGTFESQMALFISPSAGRGKPAKTRRWIRRLLEHIRELIRFSRGRTA